MSGEVVLVVLRGFPQASLGFDDQGLLLHGDGLVPHGLGGVLLLVVGLEWRLMKYKAAATVQTLS